MDLSREIDSQGERRRRHGHLLSGMDPERHAVRRHRPPIHRLPEHRQQLTGLHAPLRLRCHPVDLIEEIREPLVSHR